MIVSKRISEVESHINHLEEIAKKHLESNNLHKLSLVKETIAEHKKSLKKLETELTCEIRVKYIRNRNAIYH